MTALGEELLVVSLSPDVGRNTRAHHGVRAALCSAAILDGWVAGAALPPEKELRKYVSKHNHGTLEPALASLATSGRVKTEGRSFRYDWLADTAARAATRERLIAALSGQSAPGRRDCALAVLLYSGALWLWAFDDSPPKVTFRASPVPLRPLWERAGMLASGAVVPDGAAATDLPSVARVIQREVRNAD